jgi:hypothetical protein
VVGADFRAACERKRETRTKFRRWSQSAMKYFKWT